MTPNGNAGDASRTDFDLEHARPLVVDVDGDKIADWIVPNGTVGGYLAMSGATGKLLWRTADTQDHDPTAFAFVTGKRLVSVAESVANVFDLSNGALVRVVNVEGVPESACEAESGKVRVLVENGTILSFDADAGDPVHEPADAPCTEVRTNLAERRPNATRHTHPVLSLPADVPAVPCPSTDASSSAHADAPDACTRLGSNDDGSAAASIAPETVITTDRGALVLGHRRTGRATPAIGLFADGKLVWSAFPAVDKDGSAERVAVEAGRVALVYDDTNATRLFSWDLATGKAGLDIALSRRAQWLDARAGRWLLSGNATVFSVDEANGSIRPVVGDLQSAEPEWNPGWPVPHGYAVETHATPDAAEMGIGAAMFGGTMLLNVALYATLGDTKHDWPLLVPIVGPFINMGTVPPAVRRS